MGETDGASHILVVRAKRWRGGRAEGTKESGREKTEEGSAKEGNAEEGSAERGSAEDRSAEEGSGGCEGGVTYPMHKYIDRVSSRTSFCSSCTSLWLAPRAFSHFLTILHRQFVLLEYTPGSSYCLPTLCSLYSLIYVMVLSNYYTISLLT